MRSLEELLYRKLEQFVELLSSNTLLTNTELVQAIEEIERELDENKKTK
ncbi:MAG: hypothetical protein HY537_08010 [Deltaproteobacteria bacterium]|nr:hypothetical protein [Deltaproteobacteria bacterium]